MGFSTGSGSSAISTSSDAAISSLSNGQVISYNTSLQKWQNTARPTQLLETVNTVTSTGTTETVPDVTTATISYLTLTANCTLTFPAAAVGKSFMLVLLQDSTGSRTVTWPTTIKWPAASAPTLTITAGNADAFSFVCVDGTNWLGFAAGFNF